MTPAFARSKLSCIAHDYFPSVMSTVTPLHPASGIVEGVAARLHSLVCATVSSMFCSISGLAATSCCSTATMLLFAAGCRTVAAPCPLPQQHQWGVVPLPAYAQCATSGSATCHGFSNANQISGRPRLKLVQQKQEKYAPLCLLQRCHPVRLLLATQMIASVLLALRYDDGGVVLRISNLPLLWARDLASHAHSLSKNCGRHSLGSYGALSCYYQHTMEMQMQMTSLWNERIDFSWKWSIR